MGILIISLHPKFVLEMVRPLHFIIIQVIHPFVERMDEGKHLILAPDRKLKHFGERFELHWDGRYQNRQRSQGKAGEGWREFSSYKIDDPSGYYLAGTRVVISGRRTVILEGIGLSQEDYRRDLPELLKQKKLFHLWVAYHRHERMRRWDTCA